MEFLDTLGKIEKVVTQYEKRLRKESENLLAKHELVSTQKLKEALQILSDNERLMKIGIVGRVKAGKSSLLNALAFNGQNILPKAATPMTAALTELGHGDKFSIEIDFFTQADIENIKKDAELYDKEYQRILAEKIELLKKAKKFVNASADEIQKEAQRRTINELIETRMAASKDQYERIKKSGIDRASLDSHKNITFESLKALQQSLEDYVGSNGKYMPFTRNVKIKFQTDSFKDINIIDTPGVNDPVVSREQRTRDELGKCDVIFIVSPAGQFMSQEDLDLMDRITHKNGIRELYAVASKVDTQLVGSIKDDVKGDFKAALNRVRDILAKEMQERLFALKKSNQEVGNSYDSLIDKKEQSIICTSGIATSIKEHLDNLNELDDIESHAFNLLKEHYPKEFNTDRSITEINLNELARIDMLQEILEQVSTRKEEIMQAKIQDFSKQKGELVALYLKDLRNYVATLKQEISETNMKELESQQAQIVHAKESACMDVDLAYSNSLSVFEHELKDKLLDSLNTTYREAKGNVEEQEKVETKSGTKRVKKSGIVAGLARFFGAGGYEEREYSYQVTTVRPNAIISDLKNLVDNIEQEIRENNYEKIQKFKENVPTNIVSALRKSIAESGGDETSININKLRYIIQSIINKLDIPDISYTDKNLPYASGVLEGKEAQEFIQEAQSFIDDLKNEVKQDIFKSVNSIIHTLREVEIGKTLFNEYDKQIEQLKNDIQNQEHVIAELNSIAQALEAI